MCVDVVQVTGMPNNVMVWVIAADDMVLADQSLFRNGELTHRGMIQVQHALAAQRAEEGAAGERQSFRAVAG